ncbi:disulfide bond formation protein B [Pokkaliibacter plantistimulans]|uniref:Disulfide bond formation protein B n=1 Tax=Proteobacteria bacterium 228 TaxID=2083153 RepID=A0A2S5KLB4_9PROT|nr:disulfide bond formation protein B [Pokkaliibacter plantistimulans]
MVVGDRVVNGVVAAGCAAMLATAFYIENFMGLEPCPLCLMQRLVFAAIGLVCLLGCLHNPGRGGQRGYAGVMLLIALAGIGLAWRQLWLQSLPPEEVPACGPGIYYMLDRFPLGDVLASMIKGTGDCAEVQLFLGVSIPVWSLLAFIGCAAIALFQMFKRRA